MRERESKDSYYLKIAEAVLARSTCLRRKYGAVIVRDDEIISTGYNGSPRGASNCIDLGYCYRCQQKIPHGERYEFCRAVHAEANAIISASRRDMIGATLYLAGQEADGTPIAEIAPCLMCLPANSECRNKHNSNAECRRFAKPKGLPSVRSLQPRTALERRPCNA